jgi:hypothetical protein
VKLIGIALFVTLTFPLVSGVDCQMVAASSAIQLVDFLKRDARRSDPDCVSQAIVRLGGLRDPTGTDALISLLDFRRPLSEREKVGVGDMHDRYPAVSALFSIGERVVPALVQSIRLGHLNEVATKNAIDGIVLIYREDPPRAVAMLRKSASETKVEDEAARLNAAAKDAVNFCGSTWKDRCESALNGAAVN